MCAVFFTQTLFFYTVQSNPKSDSDSPHSRNVVADGENFTVTVGSSRRSDPSPPVKRKITTSSRGRSRSPRSRSRTPEVREELRGKWPAKKKSIKERLGPVSDTEKPTFKTEHWNGKPKQGKNERSQERNGSGRNQRSNSKDRKRDRDRDS